VALGSECGDAVRADDAILVICTLTLGSATWRMRYNEKKTRASAGPWVVRNLSTREMRVHR